MLRNVSALALPSENSRCRPCPSMTSPLLALASSTSARPLPEGSVESSWITLSAGRANSMVCDEPAVA